MSDTSLSVGRLTPFLEYAVYAVFLMTMMLPSVVPLALPKKCINVFRLLIFNLQVKENDMQGSMWWMLTLVALAGALGGVVNAFISDNGFLLPKSEATTSGATVLRPGYFGNVLVGSVAALVSWGLYGPLGTLLVAGTAEALKANVSPDKVGLTLSSLVGAVLVGVGGARWLSGEVDKNLLRATAAQAAGKHHSTEASQQISMVTPAQALDVARKMK